MRPARARSGGPWRAAATRRRSLHVLARSPPAPNPKLAAPEWPPLACRQLTCLAGGLECRLQGPAAQDQWRIWVAVAAAGGSEAGGWQPARSRCSPAWCHPPSISAVRACLDERAAIPPKAYLLRDVSGERSTAQRMQAAGRAAGAPERCSVNRQRRRRQHEQTQQVRWRPLARVQPSCRQPAALRSNRLLQVAAARRPALVRPGGGWRLPWPAPPSPAGRPAPGTHPTP